MSLNIREAMSTKMSPADIDQQISHLIADTDRHKRNFNKGWSDYTPEGRRNRWERHTARSRERVNQLRALVDMYGDAVAKKKAKIREKFTPTSTDPQVQILAEMQYARIMDRPAVKNASNPIEAAQHEIMALGATPARTLIFEEMQARGQLSSDTMDALFAASDPEYAAARTSEILAQSYKANLNGKIDQVAEYLETTPTNGQHGFSLPCPVPVTAPTQTGLCEAEDAYTLPTTIPMYDGPTVQDLS